MAITNENVVNEIIRKSEHYNRFYNSMKNKTIKELIEILENTLKSNLNVFEYKKDNLNDFDNLNHYDKYDLTNHLNYSESIIILNYLIHKKLWE